MEHVFLSYAREDLDCAKAVAAALEEAGLAVWWDRHLDGGAEYSKEIERALKAAAAVIVLWSRSSIDSAWVRDEASKGRDTGRLIPATIDGTEPPLGFGQLHTIELRRRRRRRGGGLEQIVTATTQKVRLGHGASGEGAARTDVALSDRRSWRARPVWIAGSAGFVVTAASLVYVLNPLSLGKSAAGDGGTVAVGEFEPVSADQESGRVARLTSEAIERIFATNFIETLSSNSASPGALRKADFGLNGTVDRQGDQLSVSVKIVETRSGKTLWSTERNRSADEGRQLANEMALWVADVLRCSIFVKSRMQRYRSTKLESRILRWCEAERSRGEQFHQMPAIAQELIEAAPRSAQAHGYLAVGWALGHPERREEVYAAAKKALELDPNNGPARFALAAVPDPKVSIARRDRLLREGMQLDPDYDYNDVQLGSLMMTVGRMDEARKLYGAFVSDHPLDFQQRAFWAFLLAQSGNLQQARDEFERIEQLRPGFRSATRFAIETEILFGDPLKALSLVERWNAQEHEKKCLRFVIDARLKNRPPPTEVVSAHCGSTGFFSQEAVNGLFGNADEAFAGMYRKGDQYLAIARFGPRFLYYPGLAAIRADRRFMPLMARLGIAQYWLETNQWPDFCRAEKLPYDCRRAAEAAVRGTG